MHPPTDSSMLSDESTPMVCPTRASWWAPIAGACAGVFVAFVWAMDVSPGGGEGLMGLESFARRFTPALPRALFLGIAAVLLANKLASLAPESSPCDPAATSSDIIEGHYKAAWLA